MKLKKKTRRQIKKTTKALRKAVKRAGGPVGIATGALTLGGLAAVAFFDPEVRERSRSLVGATRDFLLGLGRNVEDSLRTGQGLIVDHTH